MGWITSEQSDKRSWTWNRSWTSFPFPPGTSHDNGLPKGSDIENETNNIKTQRSISAPNVSHTIINPESILTEYGNKFGKIPQDHVRSKLPISINIALHWICKKFRIYASRGFLMQSNSTLHFFFTAHFQLTKLLLYSGAHPDFLRGSQ